MSRNNPTVLKAKQQDFPSLVSEGSLEAAVAKVLIDGGNHRLRLEDVFSPVLRSKAGAMVSPLEFAAEDNQWDFVLKVLRVITLLKDKMQSISSTQSDQIQYVIAKLLYLAAKQNNESVVSDLLRGGANPNLVVVTENEMQHSVLDWAIKHGSFEMLNALMKAGANPTLPFPQERISSLRLAVGKAKLHGEEYWHMIPILANKPAQDKATIKEYSIVLFEAAVQGQTEIVIHMLAMGADPNRVWAIKDSSNPRPYEGWTALHFAYHHNDPTMALYLMAAGADPDLVEEKGTPSFRQLAAGRNEHVDLLLEMEGAHLRGVGVGGANYIQMLHQLYPSQSGPLKIRQPRLPGPVGIAVVLLAVKALLAQLTLRICLVFNIISKKEFDVLVAPKEDLAQKPRISPAADRFFESRARILEKQREAQKPDEVSPHSQPTPTHTIRNAY